MLTPQRPQSPSPENHLIASLRSTVHRLEQSENPGAVAFLKELLIERIAALEKEARTPRSDS